MQRLVLVPFESGAAVCFAKLRAGNPSLRPPDAIQLACAMTGRCELFLTSGDRLTGLKNVGGLKIQSLENWAARGS